MSTTSSVGGKTAGAWAPWAFVRVAAPLETRARPLQRPHPQFTRKQVLRGSAKPLQGSVSEPISWQAGRLSPQIHVS